MGDHLKTNEVVITITPAKGKQKAVKARISVSQTAQGGFICEAVSPSGATCCHKGSAAAALGAVLAGATPLLGAGNPRPESGGGAFGSVLSEMAKHRATLLEGMDPSVPLRFDHWCADPDCCNPPGYHGDAVPACPRCASQQHFHREGTPRERIECFKCGHDW